MSRTDKDAPHWVRTEWYEPAHQYNCIDYFPRHRWQPCATYVECDLPETPVRHPGFRLSYKSRQKPGCTWSAIWDRRNYHNPSKKDRHLDWYGPERALVRDYCRRVRRDPMLEEDNIVEPVRQHRHTSVKGWWD
jgi:hypothetical protein